MANNRCRLILVITITFVLSLFSCASTQQKPSESEDANLYYNRGHAYGEKGQYDREIADYTRAIEIDPMFAKAYNNRGVAYGKKTQYDQAIADFNKAIEIDPKFAKAYNNRGVAYYYKKEYDKSWDDVKRAQNLGYQIPTKFLDDLQKASGRQN